MPEYFVEPVVQKKIMVPRTVHRAHTVPKMCFVNPTDQHVVLKKKMLVGFAHAVDEELTNLMDDSDDDCESPIVCTVDTNEDVLDTAAKVPVHLRDLFQKCTKQLGNEQERQFAELLISFSDVFAKDEFDLGNFKAIEHKIDTEDAKPVKHRMRRTPMCFAEEEEAHLQKMLKAGVIQPSISDWASAPVLIRKRDKSVRWCVDYRNLNSVTVKDVYPLPLVEECLDTLSDNEWFSKVDANSAYWQIPITQEDRKKNSCNHKIWFI